MRKRFIMIACGGAAALLVLATCLLLIRSSEPDREMAAKSASLSSMPIALPAPPPAQLAEAAAPGTPPAFDSDSPAEPESTASTKPIQVSVPQLAYSYVLGYRLPGPHISDAQQAHLALCQKLGPARCQLVALRHGSSDEGYANASLQLRVASSIAQRFRADLTGAIAAAGGRAADASITADDVSKDLIDTEARIRQREILVTRLTEMLRNRQGRVSELVEAERSVAAAQEELDQAKGWLGELRTRVALSNFTVNYVPATAVEPSPRSQSSRLGEALLASMGVLYGVARGLLILLIFLGPWALIGVPAALLARRWYRRRPAALAEA